MWSRKTLKENGLSAVKRYYLEAFLVSLLIAAATGGVTLQYNVQGNWQQNLNAFLNMDPSALTVASVGGGTGFLSLVFRIFLGNPLQVGGRRFYVQSRNSMQSAGFECLIEAFQSGRYQNLVKGMFMRDVIVFLFTLLLVIPGIIKAFEFLMVPYILSDEPQLEWRDVLERSKYLMYGHKLEAFKLELSFLGWYILGALLFGLGIYLVNPYREATFAEFYTALKETTPDYGAYV